MSRKKWIVSQYDKDAAAELAENYELDPFAALLLVARGVTAENADDFLLPECYIDPFELPDMLPAAERIRKGIDSFEKIAVFGDYDADGVTSSAVMYSFLESKNADVICYIPDRITEGYGTSKEAIKKLADMGVSLIITVDNGISAVEEVEYAKTLSVDMVITDHHKQSGELPKAVAVVNPQRNDCTLPFRDWAGVGVAFKTICAVENDSEEELFEKYSDLVAIGTLADVVPLKSENRAIVSEGLKHLNNSERVGINALKAVAGVSEKTLTASGVAFSLAPRINASGRMGSAMTAFKLLLCDDENTASELANEIDLYNKQRQSTETEITDEAIKQIESNPEIKYSSVIVVSGEKWHMGVVGIVAARLCGKYGKPAIVISTDGETGHGSCRSLEGFSIYDALSAVSDKINYFGGHTLAAGLGINTDKISELRTALNAYSKTVDMPFPEIRLDCKLNPAYINLDLISCISMLEPFGAGNSEPCFGLFNMQITAVKPIGEGRHLRLNVRKGNTEIQALLFSVRIEHFPFRVGDTVDLAVKISKNEFRGEIKPSVRISDMRFSHNDDENFLKSVRLYEKYRHGDALNEKEIKFLTPNRDFLIAVYKFFKNNGGWKYDIQSFLVRAGCPQASAATAMVAADILCELELITKNDDGTFSFPDDAAGKKVDLESSEILTALKSMKGE